LFWDTPRYEDSFARLLGFAEAAAGRSRFTGMLLLLLLLAAAATGVAPLRGTRTDHAVMVPSALPGWRASETGGGCASRLYSGKTRHMSLPDAGAAHRKLVLMTFDRVLLEHLQQSEASLTLSSAQGCSPKRVEPGQVMIGSRSAGGVPPGVRITCRTLCVLG